MSTDYDRRRRARQIAEARYGFRWHLPIYIIVNLVLVAIWYYSGDGIFFWPAFPIFFWGIGVFAHYMSAYHNLGGWIEKETDKILKEEEEKGKS